MSSPTRAPCLLGPRGLCVGSHRKDSRTGDVVRTPGKVLVETYVRPSGVPE